MAASVVTMARTSVDSASRVNWMRKIGEKMTEGGFVKQAIAGTVDWDAVATLPASDTDWRDWEVYAMGDALQAMVPCYVKIECALKVFRISVGVAVNASGVLSGALGPWASQSVADNATLRPCYFAGDGQRFGMALWADDPSYPLVWGVERMRKADGTPDTTGVAVAGYVGTNGNVSQVLFAGGTPGPTGGGALAVLMNGSANSLFGNYKCYSPIYPMAGRALEPMTLFGAIKASETTNLETIDVELYGQMLHMMAIKSSNSTFSQVGPGTCAWVMRYE